MKNKIEYIHTMALDRLCILWNSASEEEWANKHTNKKVSTAIQRARGMIMFHRTIMIKKPFRDRYNRLLEILDEHERMLEENCKTAIHAKK